MATIIKIQFLINLPILSHFILNCLPLHPFIPQPTLSQINHHPLNLILPQLGHLQFLALKVHHHLLIKTFTHHFLITISLTNPIPPPHQLPTKADFLKSSPMISPPLAFSSSSSFS